MMDRVTAYFSELCETFGRGWNRFWFTPSDLFSVCLLRVLTGLAALGYLLSYSVDLVRWFGPGGMLPVETVRTLVSGGGQQPVFRFSYLNFVNSPTDLWVVHLLGVAVVLLLTIGLYTRITSVLALLVVLSYIHRAPILSGQLEPVLCMLLFYLCLAPSGTYLSVDRWLRLRQSPYLADEPPIRSWWGTVSLRLIQLHLAGLYLMIGVSKLGGYVWWDGDAMWVLMAQTRSRLVDLSFLRDSMYLINAWTHAVVLFELAFAVLIWNRWARPLLLGLAVPLWGSLALITGLVSFCLLMLVAHLAFVSPELLRSLGQRRPAPQTGQQPVHAEAEQAEPV